MAGSTLPARSGLSPEPSASIRTQAVTLQTTELGRPNVMGLCHLSSKPRAMGALLIVALGGYKASAGWGWGYSQRYGLNYHPHGAVVHGGGSGFSDNHSGASACS